MGRAGSIAYELLPLQLGAAVQALQRVVGIVLQVLEELPLLGVASGCPNKERRFPKSNTEQSGNYMNSAYYYE
jgi:hypothetical protein